MTISFTVPGVPVAKGRARSFVRMMKGRMTSGHYTPSKTRAAEETFVARSLRFRPKTPLGGPLALQVTFILPVPKSSRKLAVQVSAAENESARNGVCVEVPHTKRPDLDNLVKLIKDAMNGVFWLDDSLVCSVNAKKCYGTVPRTEVRITEV